MASPLRCSSDEAKGVGDGGGQQDSGTASGSGQRSADLSCSKGDDLANETDFLDLYRRLKLSPGCELLEFKQAYRRHVALLHPDRPAAAHLDARAAELLQQLTAQYGAAMEFQRRHGRLPGAVAAPRRAASEETTVPIPCHPLAPSDVARRSHTKILVLLAVVATGTLLWSIAPLSSLPETALIPEPVNEVSQPESLASQVLSLGMSAESVRAIEGDPEAVHDGRWEYGPSWISFDHDEVVDWHSSPLRSLKTTSSRPPNKSP